MKINHQSSVLIIGLALFAMFFGSGNLIYPLIIGRAAEASWLSTSVGFLLTAVLVPFLGVIAMVLYKGDYIKFFNVIGHRMGFLLTAVLLTVWIPLGSGPRCITLAFASMSSYFGNAVPLWLFSLVYSGLVYLVIRKNIGVLDIIGRYITPVLLASISVVCVKAFFALPKIHDGAFFDGTHFINGLTEGYNTMDLIAAFFFSASVIHIISKSGKTMGQTLSTVFKSSLIGMGLLAAVYVSLISVAGHYSHILAAVPKDQLLAFLSQAVLGPAWSFVAIVAIVSACFSTSIALTLVYMEFLEDDVLKEKKYHNLSIFIALGSSFLMSLFGLEGIIFVTAPALKVCYPILIVLILFNVTRKAIKARNCTSCVAASK